MFVARIASGRTIASRSRKSSSLGPRSSTIASITRSQSARSASSVVSESAPSALSRSVAAICSLSTLRWRKCAIRSRAFSPSSVDTSRPTVSKPASIASWAMPAPMAPRPDDADSTDLGDGHDRRDPTRAPEGAVDVCRSAVVAAAARDVVDPRIHAGAYRRERPRTTMAAMRMSPNMTSWCLEMSISTSRGDQDFDQLS